MGPYTIVSSALVGLFGFAAVYHLVIWLQSRRETILVVFSLHCTLIAILAAAFVLLSTAQSTAEAQRWLDLRGTMALTAHISMVWLLSLLVDSWGRRFAALMTVAFLTATVVHTTITPLTGRVTRVDQVVMPWGEPLAVVTRDGVSPWITVIYACVFAVAVFSLVCAARVWRRDAVGGALVGLASVTLATGALWAYRVDLWSAGQPYFGAFGQVPWVVFISLQIARDYRAKGVRLAAAEGRLRAIFDQAFQFIGLLALDGTVLEANRTALAFAGVTRGDVVGRPFWETAWWTHSPDLQERLREAVRAAAAGETVRFDATHRDADGRLRDVDFSLTPARNEHGEVVLLIPEGRDISQQKQAREALERSREQLQRLASGLLLAREEERAKIARDVHDDLGQALTALKMDTQWIARRVRRAPGAAGEEAALGQKLTEISALIDDTIDTVRRIATELRPGVLDDLGLVAAAEWQVREFERRTGIRCRIDAASEAPLLDPLVSTAAFRILQESLTNAARHSRATLVQVRLAVDGSRLRLEIRDDGVGVVPEQVTYASSIGLAGMRERAQLVGGSVTVSGVPGHGTCVCAEFPIRNSVAV